MRSRARVLALRRRPDPMPWLVLWLLLGLLGAAVASTARAQQQVPPRVPGQSQALPPPATSAPTLPPGSGNDPATPAPMPQVRPDTPGGSTRNGVAVPRPNQDPGIVAPTPSAPSDMPVIRPPGSPGGNPTVIPR